MAHIQAADANAWADRVKLTLTDPLDAALEAQTYAEVSASAADAYDVSSWVDYSSTPSLIKKVMAMYYVGWYISRVYSEDDDASAYAVMLLARADKLLEGISEGTTLLTDAAPGTSLNNNAPMFYPNDMSSLPWCEPGGVANVFDKSAGPSKFSMGDCF
jgi:hypothetical protein